MMQGLPVSSPPTTSIQSQAVSEASGAGIYAAVPTASDYHGINHAMHMPYPGAGGAIGGCYVCYTN